MTTIITKNGSGAPTAGQLTTGELAVDLTNKELYTKDSGGNVIKVGAQGGSAGTFTDLTATSSFTSPGIDDNADATAITIDANENVGIGTSNPVSAGSTFGSVTASGSAGGEYYVATGGTAKGNFFNYTADANQVGLAAVDPAGELVFSTGGYSERMRIDSSGSVGIGTTPETWTTYTPVQVQQASLASFTNGDARLTNNAYYNNGWKYIDSRPATQYLMDASSGTHKWSTAASGTSDGVVTWQDHMVLDASGNVGIGTATTTFKMNVESAASTTTNLQSTSAVSNLRLSNSGGLAVVGSEANDLVLSTSTTERMRIDSSGNVGIGYNSVYNNARLTVAGPSSVGTANSHIALVGDGGVGVGNGPQILFSDSGAGADFAGGTIGFERTGSNSIGDLVFGTRRITGTSTTPTTEAMRINSSGSLLVGTTNTDPITNQDAGLLIQSNGALSSFTGPSTALNLGRSGNGTMVQFYVNGANASGGISTTQGGTPVFFAASDERLKDNIVDHESELANVMSLRPVRWDWNNLDGVSGEGFIAQELEDTAWSDLVSEGEDGFKMVSGLGAVETRLIKAMQEQQAMIETLQAEVAALKGA